MRGSPISQTPPDADAAETRSIPLTTLFKRLQSSEQGLTDEEARRRRDTYGPNETIGKKRSSGLVQFLRLFLNPLVALLLLASVVSAILGDRVNVSIIIAIVLLSNVLNFVQTYDTRSRPGGSPALLMIQENAACLLTNGGLLSKLVERLQQNREVCKNCQNSSHSSSPPNHQKCGRPPRS